MGDDSRLSKHPNLWDDGRTKGLALGLANIAIRRLGIANSSEAENARIKLPRNQLVVGKYDDEDCVVWLRCCSDEHYIDFSDDLCTELRKFSERLGLPLYLFALACASLKANSADSNTEVHFWKIPLEDVKTLSTGVKQNRNVSIRWSKKSRAWKWGNGVCKVDVTMYYRPWKLSKDELELLRCWGGDEKADAKRDDEGKTMDAIVRRIQDCLAQTRQAILQGPPGTGKTYLARKYVEAQLAADTPLQACQWCKWRATNEATGILKTGKMNAALEVWPRLPSDRNGKPFLWDIVQFHPSYSYEDFVRGIQAYETGDSNGCAFRATDRIFVELCGAADVAAKQGNGRVFLIIDEINRGDTARIFGELIFGLEDDKRGHPVATPFGTLTIPGNLYIIGTMNTADKSIAITDYALRRRFAFVTLDPDRKVIERFYESEWGADGRTVKERALAWFDTCQAVVEDRRHYAVGHSFFLAPWAKGRSANEGLAFLRFQMEYRIKPLLQEYAEDGIRLSDDWQARLDNTLVDEPARIDAPPASDPMGDDPGAA